MKWLGAIAAVGMAMAAAAAHAETISATVHAIDDTGVGAAIGTIRAEDTPKGLRITPEIGGLAPGGHAFHVHENPDCGNKGPDGKLGAGLSAGGHFGPMGSAHGGRGSHGSHGGHGAQAYRGDLPDLTADRERKVSASVTTDKLKVTDLRGRSFMIHEFANAKNGGGKRVACAVIGK